MSIYSIIYRNHGDVKPKAADGPAMTAGHQEKTREDKQQVLSHKHLLVFLITGALSFSGRD